MGLEEVVAAGGRVGARVGVGCEVRVQEVSRRAKMRVKCFMSDMVVAYVTPLSQPLCGCQRLACGQDPPEVYEPLLRCKVRNAGYMR
jgi:hypothetical protein